MEIKSLENTPLSEIVACFNLAFSDYFVPIAATEAAMEKRWRANRVDYGLSFGAFEQDKLVAFIIHGIDLLDGIKTAYNAGTGVIPEFRGQRLVSRLYAHALPKLKAAGASQSTLEVITQNQKAIKAYQGVGFTITRTLHCFRGSFREAALAPGEEKEYRLEKQLTAVPETSKPLRTFDFSWENKDEAIAILGPELETQQVFYRDQPKGYVILNPASGALLQMGFGQEACRTGAALLFNSLAKTQTAIRINNIDSQAPETVALLKTAGLENHLDQYEMLLTF